MRLFKKSAIVKAAASMTILIIIVATISLQLSVQATRAHANGPVTFTEFPLPVGARSIANGPDGNLWFTDYNAYKIGRFTLSGGVTEFPMSSTNDRPFNITSGPDGNLWFTEDIGNKIGRITPSGVITEFPLPTATSTAWGITSGPDGNIWFTENKDGTDPSQLGKIGRITPAGAITEFPVSSTDSPTSVSRLFGITTGPDGNLWFTEWDNGMIGRITPTGAITEFGVPTGYPDDIIAGPDGNLWFTEALGDKIGRITPSGTSTDFSLPTSSSYPDAITTGPDGNLWFTELEGHKVGRIATSGAITEFSQFTFNSNSYNITAGADGNLWFTTMDSPDGSNSYSLVRANLSGTTLTPTNTPTSTPTPVIPLEYVALGDSYSSGEGVTPFFEPYSTCHRSTLAYPTLINVPGSGSTYYSLRNASGYAWGFNACSGDTTAQVNTTQLIRNADPTNKNFLKLSAKTTLVTITVGGDDLEFAKVLQFCALNLTNDNCANDIYKDGKTLNQWADAQMPILKKHLQSLFTDIHMDAPNALILVIGYPQLFPATKAEQDCIQLQFHIRGTQYTLGYSNSEQGFLRAEDATLNSTIKKAVDASQSQMQITFVNVLDGFAGHEVCGNSGAYINGPSMQVLAGQIDWRKPLSKNLKALKAKDYSFHPSIAGQAEYANIINTLLQGIPRY